jgi:hypothetical protein
MSRHEPDSPKEFDLLPPLKRELLLRWIDLVLYPAATVWRDATSYGLKHAAEDDLGFYISNGQFKGAMLEAGYEPADAWEQNWMFRVRPQRRYTGEFGVARCKLTPLDRKALENLIEMVRSSEAIERGGAA